MTTADVSAQSLWNDQDVSSNIVMTQIRRRRSSLQTVFFCILCDCAAITTTLLYLPFLFKSFGLQDPEFYASVLTSCFLVAQSVSSPFWGRVSDRLGFRKPFLLCGAIATLLGSLIVGFGPKRYATAITALILIGLLNPSDVMTSTCIGELTDGSNVNSIFRLIPITRFIAGGIAGIIGAAGNLPPKMNNALFQSSNNAVKQEPPLLSPFVTISVIAVIECIVILMFLPETFQRNRPEYVALANTDSAESATLISPQSTNVTANPTGNSRNIILVIFSYMLFTLTQESYTVLLVSRAVAPKPFGAGITPEKASLIVLIVGLSGLLLQFFSFTFFVNKFGIERCYRVALLLVSIISCTTSLIGFEGVFLTFMMVIQIVNAFANMLITSCSKFVSSGNLGMANGALVGVNEAVQIVGFVAMPKIWNLLFRKSSALGLFLVWNILGIICMAGFGLALYIRLPDDPAEDEED